MLTSNYQLSSLEIDGFRGERKIEAELGDVTFVIGRNGTGKTTLINMLLAVLRVNVKQLSSYAFNSLRITFQSPDPTRSHCSLRVTRKREDDIGFLIYNFDNFPSESAAEIVLLDLSTVRGDKSFRRLSEHALHLQAEMTSELMRAELARYARSPARDRDQVTLARKHISSIIALKNISVSRWSSDDAEDHGKGRPDVDRKIARQLDEIAIILNKMDRGAASLLEEYQAEFFLSLTDRTMLSDLDVGNVNVDHDVEKLGEIFASFRLAHAKYQQRLVQHRAELSNALDAFQTDKALDMQELAAFLDGIRLHSFVDKWEDLLIGREDIYSTKNTFENVLNEMYLDKRVKFGKDNSINILRASTSIDIDGLASGEKQLFIFLAEAFIQQNTPTVLIADEPEISLHIEWQSQLVGRMRKLNPHGQLIFATHSPDIVAEYRDNVISLG
jgi:energy-coupling factor transporter ATP-binding protein EcfA2